MTIETEVQSLRQVSMFREIDPAKLKLLAFTSDRLSYDKGDVLFRQHEISDSTYVIVEGKVEVWLEGLDAGRERIKVAELGAGAIVGEMGVLCDQPRSATIEAACHVVALKIGREVFFDMLRQFPQMSVAVMRDLARRLDATNAKLLAVTR
ncbi:Cyclic nucleotide-binding domain-containing protein [Rhizobiales bacterium GAS191]|jgi:CRP/FNR family cyclic AMP-dependent transcriptional regulator|nr:Cyclic nucleotide-binding domain-containing protein [Rhizobiales bacterium GAS113]SED34672.1 Cyclic nucleotide-binding domain-containing protein [Rhizobiales bacterium GAS188]SEE95921.1 Cyclic nucleotide-binding domain-containing protein [Rhizobiales bacterium GAS191]